MTGPSSPGAAAHHEARIELAAAFRWFHRLDMHEGIANHFTLAPDPDDRPSLFLCQPFGTDFGSVRASDLVLVDLDRPDVWCREFGTVDKGNPLAPPPIEPTAFCIHGEFHRLLGRRAKCILHLHPHYATALSCLRNRRNGDANADADVRLIPPIDQTCARFFRRLSIDDAFGGMEQGSTEAQRLAKCMGDRNWALLMANHGCLVIGESVGVCIDRMFYLERAARTYVTALSAVGGGAGHWELSVLPDAVAERTAQQWEEAEPTYALATIRECMRVLDREGKDYRS